MIESEITIQEIVRNFAHRWKILTGEAIRLSPMAGAKSKIRKGTETVNEPQKVAENWTAIKIEKKPEEMPENRSNSEQTYWPESLAPHLVNFKDRLLITRPPSGEDSEVREIEQFTLEALAQATNYIYIENQFLTSKSVVRVLCEHLQKSQGPRVLILVSGRYSHWLEDISMGVLQSKSISQLLRADVHKRLGVFSPYVKSKFFFRPIIVHSKILLVDDTLLKVGSANLNNRSMGFDSEMDLAIQIKSDAEGPSTIRQIRDKLIAEHLGIAPETATALFDDSGLQFLKLEAQHSRTKILRRYKVKTFSPIANYFSRLDFVDPDTVSELERLVQSHFPVRPIPSESFTSSGWFRYALIVVFIATLTAIIPQSASANTPWTLREILGVLLSFGVFGLTLLPISPVLLLGFLVLGSPEGLLIMIPGASLYMALSYAVGRVLPEISAKALAVKRSDSLTWQLLRLGILPGVLLIVLPSAPFAVIGLLAGASRMEFGTFLRGSAWRILPLVSSLAAFFWILGTFHYFFGTKILMILSALFLLTLVFWMTRSAGRIHLLKSPDKL